jgi:uncharacterized membrane protein
MHALLWHGTANGYADLNPAGCDWSSASGTNGTQQAGYADVIATGGHSHAFLWSGSAATARDLNPAGYDDSFAYGICGTQQVGFGVGPASGDSQHALLWTGTAESMIDLNPGGFTLSNADATNGSQQVGYGYGSSTGYKNHALLWNGSADGAVDLHQFLAAGFTESYARAIDAQGNIVGSAIDASGYAHAILWQPVPEPSTIVLLGFGVLGLFAWGRKRSRKG